MGNTPVANGACPSGWTMFQNKCYYKPSGSFTHDACYTSCQSLTPPARLLCIESAAENANIYASFTSNVWIGLSDSITEGSFVWPSTCSSTFLNFQQNEPSGDQNSNFVIMTTGGLWDDVHNTDSNVCQCEIYAIGIPTSPPTISPSAKPTTVPTSQPSSHPTRQPVSRPTGQPSSQPSRQPSAQPNSAPTLQPSAQPTSKPSSQPSSQPTRQPSLQPTNLPSSQPSTQPSSRPSLQPSAIPSAQPTARPSAQPSSTPTVQPSVAPSSQPSRQPTGRPSSQPSGQPSAQPSTQPTGEPSAQPTDQPTGEPSAQPSTHPSVQPSSMPSMQPSGVPSVQPSSAPSGQPTFQPSTQPTAEPTSQPSSSPSSQPSGGPSCQPTVQPSVQPSGQPSQQPSYQPTAQPSAVPSTQPSCQPSARPTTQPSAHPSMQPSASPSSQPSEQPTTQPTGGPSVQPSSLPSGQPSGFPTTQPSRQPTARPSLQPSSQPSHQPSTQPSSQPSRQPSSQPSTQPSHQPSSQPTSAPSTTGEWTSAVNGSILFSTLSYINSSVWACGGLGRASCTLADALTGELTTEFQFLWDSVTSALVTSQVRDVYISGRVNGNNFPTSTIARCTSRGAQLTCSVSSLAKVNLVAGAYNAYSDRIVYVGQNINRAAVTVYNPTGNLMTHEVYSAPALVSLVVSHVRSPPNFLGTFVAGTGVGSSAAASKCIFAGWLRTDTGQMAAAIGITPVRGSIVSTVGLVNAMALEATGPDSFIAGGLELGDGAPPGKTAYVIRVNALYKTVQFGIRYRAIPTSGRRALSASPVASSAITGLALTSSALYAIVDLSAPSTNLTSLSVLKLNPATGAILSQAHVSALNAALHCTDITIAGVYLTIACMVTRSFSKQSVLIAVNRDLSFIQLPAGFTRHSEPILQAESVAIKATVITISSTVTTIATADSQFTTSESAPSRRPSLAPSARPTVRPSSAPTARVSSAPSSMPSVSAQPTSLPSTSGPTVSLKPTVTAVSTFLPSVLPTAASTMHPTAQTSVPPTVRSTAMSSTTRPSTQPSAAPTVAASWSPSVRPTRLPTQRPATAAPSVSPTAEGTTPNESTADDLPAYVIGASVGGAVCFGLCGMYVLFRRRFMRARLQAAAKKSHTRFVVFGDISEPYSRCEPVVLAAMSQWNDREQIRDESIAEGITAGNRMRLRTLSAFSSSSYHLSSLHTSERSDVSDLDPDIGVEHSLNCVHGENTRTEQVEEDDHEIRSDSSIYSESSSDDHSSSGSDDFEDFDQSSDAD